MSYTTTTVIHLAPGDSEKTGIASYADLVDQIFNQYLTAGISIVRVEPQEFVKAFRSYDKNEVLILAQIGATEGAVYRALQVQNSLRPELLRIIEIHDPPYFVLSYYRFLDTIASTLAGRFVRRVYHQFMGRWHIKKFINPKDIFICKTKIGTSILKHLMLSMGKNNQCYHVPHPTYIDPLNDGAGRNIGRIRIGFMGHIASSKGLHILVQAAIELAELSGKESIPEIEIRGRAINDRAQKYLDALISKVAEYGLSDRILIGDFIPDDQVEEFFNRITILALPYLDKGRTSASGPLMWARSCGVPVIAHDTVSFCELINDGIDGILISPCGVERWVQVFRQLMDDHSLIRTLRSGVKLRQSESAWSNVANRYLEVMRMQVPAIGRTQRIV